MMIELNNYELENIYGENIAAISLIAGLVLLAVATFKVATSQSAKINLPGGTSVDFKGSRDITSSSNNDSNHEVTSKQKVIKSISELPLKQLVNISNDFASTPGNFLVKC